MSQGGKSGTVVFVAALVTAIPCFVIALILGSEALKNIAVLILLLSGGFLLLRRSA